MVKCPLFLLLESFPVNFFWLTGSLQVFLNCRHHVELFKWRELHPHNCGSTVLANLLFLHHCLGFSMSLSYKWVSTCVSCVFASFNWLPILLQGRKYVTENKSGLPTTLHIPNLPNILHFRQGNLRYNQKMRKNCFMAKLNTTWEW